MKMINSRKEYHAPMHTVEHIFNQAMVRKFGVDRSFSNHIERKKSKCDYHFDRDLSPKELSDLENSVNEIIKLNLPVSEKFINISDAQSQFNLSRLPEETGNNIRVIKIGDYDACPCSGNHVENTIDIGHFKIISTSHNENVLRVRFKLLNEN